MALNSKVKTALTDILTTDDKATATIADRAAIAATEYGTLANFQAAKPEVMAEVIYPLYKLTDAVALKPPRQNGKEFKAASPTQQADWTAQAETKKKAIQAGGPRWARLEKAVADVLGVNRDGTAKGTKEGGDAETSDPDAARVRLAEQCAALIKKVQKVETPTFKVQPVLDNLNAALAGLAAHQTLDKVALDAALNAQSVRGSKRTK
jgi:hypothetical protein